MTSTTLNQTELCSLENILSTYVTQKTSIALSSLLGESVSHHITKTHTEVSKIENLKNFANELVLCSVFLYGGGDIRLGILYSIPEDDAKQIAAKLLCMEKVDSLDDLGKSAISEVGNIMSGSFFNALYDHTGLKVDLSTPDFAMTSISALLEPHASGFLCPIRDILTEIELIGANSGLRVHMLIIQDHDNARKLLNSKR
ncbi:MAG: chemotaxis protein CheC [Patescibacteria group bacterium]|nr:chemotaxis protein CheC [Patescibacteria group bacterium]